MFVVDAYNALHCSQYLPDAHAMVSATGLAQLLDKHDVPPHRGGAVVVADGSPKPDDHPELDLDRARVIFSGPNRDADSVIESFIDRHASPRDLIVVSNDRRLQRAARRRRATVWTSEQFMIRLAKALNNAANPDTLAQLGKPDQVDTTEDWMRRFGFDDDQSAGDHDTPDTRHRPPQTPRGLESETQRWMREFGYDPDAE